MLAASYGSVGDIEIMWCIIAACGLVFSLYTLVRATGDRRILIREGIGNGRRKIAAYAVFAEGARAAIQFIFLCIGVIACFLPQSDTSALPTVQLVEIILIQWGLILSSILLTTKSVLAYILRKKIVGD